MPVKNYFHNLYKILGQHSFLIQKLVYAAYHRFGSDDPGFRIGLDD